MIMEELIIRLYQQGIITSAQGSRLLSMDRLRFEYFLAKNKIPIHGESEDLDSGTKNLEKC